MLACKHVGAQDDKIHARPKEARSSYGNGHAHVQTVRMRAEVFACVAAQPDFEVTVSKTPRT